MNVVQAWIGNSFFNEDQEHVRQLLLSSARHWKALYPEDSITLFLPEQFVSRYFRCYEGNYEMPWRAILGINETVELPLHDSSRFHLMTLGGSEPFIYLDSDFLVFEKTREQLDFFRQKILSGNFVKGSILMDRNDIGHGNGEDQTIRGFCACLDYPYNPLLCRKSFSSTVLVGGPATAMYVVGNETLKIHKLLGEYKHKHCECCDLLHEWVSGVFPELVLERFGIPLEFEDVESHAYHAGLTVNYLPGIETSLDENQKKQVLVKVLEQEREDLTKENLLSSDIFETRLKETVRSLG